MTPLELALREEERVDDAVEALWAVFIRYRKDLLARAVARAIRRAELYTADAPSVGAAPDSIPERGNAPPLTEPIDIPPPARLPEEERPATRRWNNAGQRVEADDDPSLVLLTRKANGAAQPPSVPDEPTGDIMLRRVLWYIAECPGANLTTLRKNVQGRIEHISEALRTALAKEYVQDTGKAPRRELVLTDAGRAFLAHAAEVPLPPPKGSKSELLEALLKERGRVSIDEIAERLYGASGSKNEGRARSLLHHFILQRKAEKVDGLGMYAICAGATQ
ncbi:MAG TPA: hypothetical protein VFB99_13780 [Vicinamibacterales bacterium]|nr:hypothetical protein [Vicinamibacterales bacterium]